MDKVSDSLYIYRGETTLFHYSILKIEIPSSSQKVQSSFFSSQCPLYSCKKLVRRSRRNRDWKESVLRGVEKSGREDQAGMTCLLSGILNSWKFKKTHKNKNLWEKITNRFPQKVNLELFSINRTMKYQMSGTFLGAAEEVKHLHSTQQFTPPATFDCQTLSVEWKNHGTEMFTVTFSNSAV